MIAKRMPSHTSMSVRRSSRSPSEPPMRLNRANGVISRANVTPSETAEPVSLNTSSGIASVRNPSPT
jgi:hypothetical protein